MDFVYGKPYIQPHLILMKSLSVVIIARNSISTISEVINSALSITNDVILVDSGSVDGTDTRASGLGAKVIHTTWKGFGAARNEGAGHAQGDYILYLDSDEVITPEAAETLRSTTLQRDTLYGFRRRNFVGRTEIRHGEWAHDRVYRLHFKSSGKWTLDEVHERLVVGGNRTVLKGNLLHYTTPSIEAYAFKLDHYATLSASNNYRQNKKAGPLKPALAATFNFMKNYFFRLGILDGALGWQLASLHARYTFNKYYRLRRLYKTLDRQQKSNDLV